MFSTKASQLVLGISDLFRASHLHNHGHYRTLRIYDTSRLAFNNHPLAYCNKSAPLPFTYMPSPVSASPTTPHIPTKSSPCTRATPFCGQTIHTHTSAVKYKVQTHPSPRIIRHVSTQMNCSCVRVSWVQCGWTPTTPTRPSPPAAGYV